MTKTAEEKMFWILLMVGADILGSVKALKLAAGIDNCEEDGYDLRPTFDAETLRIAAYDQDIEGLYAVAQLSDESLDLPPDVDPLTKLACSYLNAIQGIASDGNQVKTNEGARALHQLNPIFSGVSDNLPLDKRMRFLIVHAPRFTALRNEPYAIINRDPSYGRPETDYKIMLDAFIAKDFTPARHDERSRVALYNDIAARITANPIHAPMDPEIARSMFM